MNKEARGLTAVEPTMRFVAVPDPDYYGEPKDLGSDRGNVALRAVWGAVYRNRFLIAAIIVVCALLGLAVALLSTPIYRATASIQIDQQSAKVLGTEDLEPTLSPLEAERFLQTQVDVIRSRSLAERVSKDLRLPEREEFLNIVGPAADQQKLREKVLTTLRDNLSVDLPRNSRVVRISFDSPSPHLSAEIANSFGKNHIVGNLQRRFDTSTYSRDFLQGQLAETKRRLEQSERAMIAYARGARLIDASGGISGADQTGPRSLTTSNLVQLNQSYSAAKSARIQAQQRWGQAQATPLMSLPEVLSNSTVQDLVQRRAELQAQMTEERQRRKEDHPAIIQARAEIEELDRQIGAHARSIRLSIRDQFLVAAKQEAALSGNVGQLKNETLAEQDRGVRYNILKREADTNRELYDGLLQRFKEISAAAGVTINNIAFVDEAEPPLGPIKPRPLINLILGGFGGLALALLLVAVREKIDDHIRSPEDVEEKLDAPLLGVIPKLSAKLVPRDLLLDPKSSLSEAYLATVTTLELSSDTEETKGSLLVSSSTQSEGKSTSALAIAKTYADLGRKVLLLDADLRRPNLHRLAGVEKGWGLTALLTGKKTLGEVVVKLKGERIDFIPAGRPPANPALLLSSNAFRNVIRELCRDYHVVVIDGPPVMGFADAPRLSELADHTVFVVQATQAHRGRAKTALKRLFVARARIAGVILTKYDPKKNGLGAYDSYSYDYKSIEGKKGSGVAPVHLGADSF